jgi:hypothetical protein
MLMAPTGGILSKEVGDEREGKGRETERVRGKEIRACLAAQLDRRLEASFFFGGGWGWG